MNACSAKQASAGMGQTSRGLMDQEARGPLGNLDGPRSTADAIQDPNVSQAAERAFFRAKGNREKLGGLLSRLVGDPPPPDSDGPVPQGLCSSVGLLERELEEQTKQIDVLVKLLIGG